jgi:hypothetical protein
MDCGAYALQLFAYQRACVARMRALEQGTCGIDTRVGVLADPPGAGKTRVVIALVCSDGAAPNVPPPILADHVVPGLVRVEAAREPVPVVACADTTLVVVSQSLVAQWERELRQSEQCGASMIVVRVNKDVARLDALIRGGRMPKVVLSAVLRYRAVCAVAGVRTFRRVVVDEAMHMRDASMSVCPATAFTWLVSAASERPTSREIVPARSRAYWAPLVSLPDDAFLLLAVRTPTADIVYPGTVRTLHYTCALDTALAFAASPLVSDHVRALLEANDIHAAIAAMGGAPEEDLMTVVRRRIRNDMQLAALERSRLALLPAGTRHDAQVARLDARDERLRRDAQSADERFGAALCADCPICHDTMRVPVLLTCCQVLFCAECIMTWWAHALQPARACPSCRSAEFRIERIAQPEAAQAAQPQAQAAVPPLRGATKTEEIVRIVAAARGGVMVYSCHVAGLRRAIAALREAGHTTEEIKGQSCTRDKRLRDFASGAIKVLALDATLNCAGIDMQSLSDVVIYHEMPDSVKEQIVGRGHRVNRSATLNVHCLWE